MQQPRAPLLDNGRLQNPGFGGGRGFKGERTQNPQLSSTLICLILERKLEDWGYRAGLFGGSVMRSAPVYK